MPTPVTVALAGISGYGHAYVEALLANRPGANFRLAACVDPYPQACKHVAQLAAASVPIYPSMQALFAARHEIELVLLATPIHLHATQIAESLDAGASVLCEKPLAGSVRDAQRVLRAEAAALRQGRFVGIGFQWSFSRAVIGLKRDIRSGALGKPIRFRTRVDFPREIAYFRRNAWAGRMHAADGEDVFDSPVNNATAHYLHNMLFVLGDRDDAAATPTTVQAELYRANDIENYDTAALRCEAGETELLFYTTHATSSRCGPAFVYEFEHATVRYDHLDGEIRATFKDGRSISYGSPERDRDRKVWMAIDSVRTGEPLLCTPRTAYPHVLCAAAAQQSSITPFPEALRHLVPGETTDMVIVEGLSDTLAHCFERGVLPSELTGLRWARRGEVIRLDSVAPASGEPLVLHA